MEECALIRPEWTAETGPVSSFAEFLILLNTPLGYLWIAALLLLIWKRRIWSGLLLAAYSFGLIVEWVIRYSLNDDLWIGFETGCIGALDVTVSTLAASILLGLGTAAHSIWMKRPNHGQG